MLWHSINDEGFTKWQIIGNINPVSMELSMERNHRGLQTGSYGHGKNDDLAMFLMVLVHSYGSLAQISGGGINGGVPHSTPWFVELNSQTFP